MLTTFDLDEYVYDALRPGASGFLLKDAPPERAGRTPSGSWRAGDALLAPAVTRRLIEQFAAPAGARTAGRRRASDALTDREREVLGSSAGGCPTREIAAALVVSEATVKTHVSRMLTKLGLRDRVQAVVLAYESGLVRPGEQDAHQDRGGESRA